MPPEGPDWRTAITDVGPDHIRYRGYDLGDVVGRLDFAETAFLLVTGDPPGESEARVFNALLAAAADHAVSPTAAVTRYTAAGGSPVQASVAAGLLTIGDHLGGAGERAAELFSDHLRARDGDSMEAVAAALVEGCTERGERVPGYGHPEHLDGDPRAPLLLDLARKEGVADECAALSVAVEDALRERVGPLPMNVDGVSAALLLDLGFDPSFARPFVLMARVPGLIAHAVEEGERERPWRRVAGERAYDGPGPRDL